MTLTPIHIRCKRKAPSSSRIPEALHMQCAKMRRSLKDVQRSRLLRPRSTLDSLPAEILEGIFLYSTNLALARSSPVIGVKLSGRATRLRLFIWGFHETWLQWFGISTSGDIFHGPYPRSASLNLYPDVSIDVACDGDPELQTALLKLPWVTIDFVLQAQQTWADTYAAGRWYSHYIPWNDPEDPFTVNHAHDGGFEHFHAAKCFAADYHQALKWKPFQQHPFRECSRDIHPKARLPTKLITGPWDEDKLQLLFWCCRGGFDVDKLPPSAMPTWEDMVKCLCNAVLDASEPNTLVIQCLVRATTLQGFPKDVSRKLLRDLDKRLAWGDDTSESRQILNHLKRILHFWINYPEA